MQLPNEILNLIKEYSRPRFMKPFHSKIIECEIKKYKCNIFKNSFYEYFFCNEADFMRRWGWVLNYSELQDHI